jgi:PAS domain S-box-containing protein
MITGKQILIVEDEIITALDIQKRLINFGYNVPVIVGSGEQAILKVNENKPDLVLMDINLNGEMDGIEAASKIQSFSDIPVIYLTAFSDNKTLARAKITEPYAYIMKPFKDRELLINIEIALYKHTMEKMLKESHETIREQNQWLVATIENISDAVIATDLQGRIRLMNPIAEALTGWTNNEALGKPLANIFNIIGEDIDEKIEDPITKAIREDMFYGLAEHTALVTKEGMKKYVDIIGSTIKMNGTKIIGFAFIFDDNTWRTSVDNMLKISANC